MPDVLVLDLSMPAVTGIEAAGRIAKDCPNVRILVLTMHEERAYELGVSVKPIETHKANGMTKLGLTSRAALDPHRL